MPNELIGCELRVALEDAMAAKDVFLAGTVISHLGATVKVRDPGHAIKIAWNKTSGVGQAHKPSACFFDVREGCYRGVIGAATPGTWLGQSVTFLTVDDGPFETWMVSYSTGPYVYVQLGSQSAKVIGADQPADSTNFPGNGFKRLILEGQGYSGAAAGEWYTIKGNCTSEEICRSGTWAGAPGCTGGLTTFVLEDCVELRDEQLGWWLQPNISCQAFFPIVNISKASHTVTVAGDQRGLGQQGTRFRIHAPPGVQARGPRAGLLPMFAEATSSRYLYRGYRYENPASGRWDDVSKSVAARQDGGNFTGQHYTLFRHFDPSLMRFTSLDPLASSSNLFSYCENNPHGGYDPDGLETLNVAEMLKRAQDRSGTLGGSIQGREWSQAYSGGGIGATLRSLPTVGSGLIYGAANTLTFGGYGRMISRKQYGDYWGVDASSDAFQSGERAGVLTGTALIMTLTAGGVSTALGAAAGCGYSGVMAMVGEGIAWGAASVVGGNAAMQAIEGRWMTADENVGAFVMGFGGGFGNRGLFGAAAEARELFGSPGSSVCFVVGTQVATQAEDGTLTGKNIENIKLGDWVWSRNDETGEEGYKPVVHLFRNTTEDLAHLTYTSGKGASSVGASHDSPACGASFTLTGTPGHKFWSETRHEWTPMGELRPGEKLKLADGQTATVSACTVEHLTKPVAIFNFEVADWHTYHVGDVHGWVFVHNKCTPGRLKKWLNEGAEETSVYLGKVAKKNRYAGITDNFLRRETEHLGKYKLDEIAAGLSRHKGRAVEQAIIKHNPDFDNINNSISPRRDIYEGAVKWGEKYLRRNGFGHLLR